MQHISPSTQPVLRVGIMSGNAIDVTLHGTYLCDGTDTTGRIRFTARGMKSVESDCGQCATSIRLIPTGNECKFTLSNVTIGIGFHWQQHENQTFEGMLEIISDGNGQLHAINHIDVESYLLSVVSSEMNANAPEEFLKAHAVISRSWVLAQIHPPLDLDRYSCTDTEEECVRWYDKEAHRLFDVCADDHCQRYQGCTRASTPQVASALKTTRGQVLTFDGALCDARFSKCCGGITERFSTCWQPVDTPYLQVLTDAEPQSQADCSAEHDARRWIISHPDAFCANPSDEVLASILNNYDRDTPHLYRWSISYTAAQLSDIIRRRSGLDYGRIISLTALHRGPSGRIDRLEIRGTRLTRIIGKELEIRRTLSESHLYSSAFVAEPHDPDSEGIPTGWTLHGAGWGHGVGLCQTGAAVMATKGYSYDIILSHYFPGTRISTLYR